MEFDNVYDDAQRAAAYAKLEFPGTYYLAYRDLPEIVAKHVNGFAAIDFGCGTGRSTRFLQRLGFQTLGLDIAAEMIDEARRRDPRGDYRLVKEGDFSVCQDNSYDLVLSAFTFDNIPTIEKKIEILRGIGTLLKNDGRMINLVSAPEIYTHEWASFTTKGFPENLQAKSGDKVSIIMTDVVDQRPVEDILWSEKDYRKVYAAAGLEVVQMYQPLGREDESFTWVNETKIAPWVIYVLKKG